jgi:hypothetical protein
MKASINAKVPICSVYYRRNIVDYITTSAIDIVSDMGRRHMTHKENRKEKLKHMYHGSLNLFPFLRVYAVNSCYEKKIYGKQEAMKKQKK